MTQRIGITLLCLLLALTAGCGTLLNLGYNPGVPFGPCPTSSSKGTGPREPFGGVEIVLDAADTFLPIHPDLLLSFVGDVLTLPVTLNHVYLQKQRIQEEEIHFGPLEPDVIHPLN